MLRTKGNYSNTFVTEYMMVICLTTVDWYTLHNACSYGHYEVAELLLEVVMEMM